jgi:hypothetical protein
MVLLKDDILKKLPKTEEKRGKWKRKSIDFDNEIENYIMSFNPKKTHYNLSRAPNGLYINGKFNMSSCKLYKKFIETKNSTKNCTFNYFKNLILALGDHPRMCV